MSSDVTVVVHPGERDWMYVVIQRPTGVRYDHQYGTACLQRASGGLLGPR